MRTGYASMWAGLLVFCAVCGCRRVIVVQAPINPDASRAPASVPSASTPGSPAVISLSVEPSVIEPGQRAILNWKVAGAKQIVISPEGGSVASEGSREISAVKTTVYTLLASGSGQYSAAAVTLRVLPAEAASPGAAAGTADPVLQAFESEIRDIYFDFNRFDLQPGALQQLTRDAAALQEFFRTRSSLTVAIEGHTDETGSWEYNLALGDRRAAQVREILVTYGVSANRLRASSFGSERPQCQEPTPECQARNRRVHFAPLEMTMRSAQ